MSWPPAPPREGPLAGIRVVDLTRLAPGPYGTMLLGDLGADVITVEPPAARRKGADVSEVPLHGGGRARAAGLNPLYRSRRSIVLDLKTDDGSAAVLGLVDDADVFVEGFRPGVCERLGLGYRTLSARNPRLVYCSLTGYGQDGPLAHRPGHDLNYLAESGLLAITTRDGNRPGIPLNVAADFAAGGLLAAFGVLAALRGRDATGRGAIVDVSMLEGLLSMLATAASWHAVGAPDPSYGAGLVSGAAPFYDCYRTTDGRWLAVGAIEPKFFAALCEGLRRPDLVALQHDETRWPELRAAFEQTFATKTLDEWLTIFAGVDTAVSPVRTLSEAFDAARAAGYARDVCTVGPVPRIEGWPREVGDVARRAGADQDDVLA